MGGRSFPHSLGLLTAEARHLKTLTFIPSTAGDTSGGSRRRREMGRKPVPVRANADHRRPVGLRKAAFFSMDWFCRGHLRETMVLHSQNDGFPK